MTLPAKQLLACLVLVSSVIQASETKATGPSRVAVPARLLRDRGNELEIRVANLWLNRLIGDAGLPSEQRRTWTTRNPFHKDTPLAPSGLLGPVRILAAE